jgi:hypothetical protein
MLTTILTQQFLTEDLLAEGLACPSMGGYIGGSPGYYFCCGKFVSSCTPSVLLFLMLSIHLVFRRARLYTQTFRNENHILHRGSEPGISLAALQTQTTIISFTITHAGEGQPHHFNFAQVQQPDNENGPGSSFVTASRALLAWFSISYRSALRYSTTSP